MERLSDSIPLLVDTSDDETECSIGSCEGENPNALHHQSEVQLTSFRLNSLDVDDNINEFDEPQGTGYSPQRDIICIFVVAFDSRTGNIIEWSMPRDVDLDGVEFKAIASGLHHIKQDFIYFKKKKLYGLACFENMRVDSELERGARMKSIGVLASSYTHLHPYKSFLESQVRLLLKTPGQYSFLEKFYTENCGMLCRSESLFGNEIFQQRHHTKNYPTGCFIQFIQFFRELIFPIWKLVLLRKRILFFSIPPVGISCHHVLCASSLLSHTVPEVAMLWTNVLFYVNIADIEILESLNYYIACTTEKIFEMKRHLYDLYVDGHNVMTHMSDLKDILQITATDRMNFTNLCSSVFQMPNTDSESDSGDSKFIDFFTNLNTNLFEMLLTVSRVEGKRLTHDHIKGVGLDPYRDKCFLSNLIQEYNLDIILPSENSCCCCCFCL